MYTAPPGPDEDADETTNPTADTETGTTETPTPETAAADTTPTAADANWTGTLPADD